MTNVIKKEDLEKLKYVEFKDKFEELGILDAYKHGNKKEVYIKTILETLDAKNELKETNPETTTKDAENLVKEKSEAFEAKSLSEKRKKFKIGVDKVIAKKDFWTKETMQKRIEVLKNVFVQHRDSIKGSDALKRAEIYEAALERLYK